MSERSTVLVTGGSGFLAGHVLARLLQDGYPVRTTVRTPRRADDVHTTLTRAGADTAALTTVTADLTADGGWPAALDGVGHVLHVASPFPARQPRNEDDVIVPAREGTLRVLRAAAAAGVPRVVMTSSFAAIGYSPKAGGAPYDETDWTDTAARQSPYVKSKTLAERAAWDFVATADLELTVVNPVGIFGPVLGTEVASSVGLIQALLDGKPPVLPRASFAVVDVRDVADLHVRAMTSAAAAGERFLASAGQPVTLPEIAAILRSRLGDRGHRVPRWTAPDWLVRRAARMSPSLETFAELLGEPKRLSIGKSTDVLGWRPRPVADTMTDTALSLLDRVPLAR
ncbi:NAD-dependent epimerase/dehydratase family protein [Mycobacterium sp. PS03-16]|uniref:NAD-dependent epimerase/dehydratase family protein n=1 Tax=Mycobacterium sp. PS03-16 TaxID=2559611 RepID=UPI0010735AE0|nr:NAD-dependent epimerase/dehydratase family protein [Mycobacterium sp. PS03-16]TFV58868.1 NAD-dependent epimerase/dehydratase family protein [Mycobacterium sp. PS03-16]